MQFSFKFFLIVILVSGCKSLIKVGEDKISAFEVKTSQVDTIITSMLENCKIVLKINGRSSGRGSKEGFPIHYLGFTRTNSYAIMLKGVRGNVNGISTIIGTKDTASISKEQANSILKLFENKAWNLNYNDKDTAGNYCFWKGLAKKETKPCEILDGKIYYLKSITRKGYTESILYAPDFYEEECCKGNINRINFLSVKKLIDDVWGNQAWN